MFCRPCLLRCLDQKSICPICKFRLKPKYIHEIDLIYYRFAKGWTYRKQYYGSKMTHLIHFLNHLIEERKEKVMICIQWSSLLRSVYNILRKQHIRVKTLLGNTTHKCRVVEGIKKGTVDVLLLSLDRDYPGLDVVEINHIIFFHALLMDSQTEFQRTKQRVLDKVHRRGQTRSIYIYWMVAQNTIEEELLQT